MLRRCQQPHKYRLLHDERKFELEHEAGLEPDQGHRTQIDIDGIEDVLGCLPAIGHPRFYVLEAARSLGARRKVVLLRLRDNCRETAHRR